MTESVGKNASDGSRENAPIESGAVHTLAQVLEQEFRDLHESDLLKQTHAPFGQDSTPVTEAKQQQPLCGLALMPALR